MSQALAVKRSILEKTDFWSRFAKKEGKIHFGELIISTNRAAKKLVKNFDLILNKKYKIVKSNDFGNLDYETIKNLFAHLKQLKALHKTEFARNHDMPGEDDV